MIADAQDIGGCRFAFSRFDHAQAFEFRAIAHRWHRKDGFRINQAAPGFEMKDAARRVCDYSAQAQLRNCPDQRLCPDQIGSRGQPYHHAVDHRQHIAAICKAFRQSQNRAKTVLERSDNMRHFAASAVRSGIEKDSALRKRKRDIFYKDRIRKNIKRVKHINLKTGTAQSRDIGDMLDQQTGKAWISARAFA